MKKSNIQDHIGTFDNYFPDELCDKYINYFDKITLNPSKFTTNGALNRNSLKHVQDTHYCLMTELYDHDLNINYVGADFQKIFWEECYPKYIEKYPIIKEFDRHRILDLKIQKTEKGQGYHTWHAETMQAKECNRFIVISLYLNTVEKGGETEFLNQSLRVPAIKNRFLMFPATYTHVHRGNPPLSGSKYIITGWVEF